MKSLFDSFFMGGFECSTHRNEARRRLDIVAQTKHDRFALEDYRRLKSVGILTARDGVRWHLVERSPNLYDFSSVLGQVRAAETAGVQVLWDLLHYGYPDGMDFFSAEFVDRFANFARAFVKLLTSETDRQIYVVPVNEISFFAWCGGHEGVFNPFTLNRAGDVKRQLVRASIAAIEGVWDIEPKARIIHTDPVINVIADPDRPEDRAAAEGHKRSQYEAWDMIAGRAFPELGGKEKYLDILGINYYIHNQWRYPGGHGSLIEPSHPAYRPPWQIFKDAYQRYQRPMFLAETGIEGDARATWLRYISHQVREAVRNRVPIRGMCLYPILNHEGWVDGRHCYNGLWDIADERGERSTHPQLAAELALQSKLFEAFAQPDRWAETEEPSWDGAMLDLAAHWMEDTSSVEDQRQEKFGGRSS
jgi:beta-glucosidase/6-phospho-beta-glucosidase/beta-galactosidase